MPPPTGFGEVIETCWQKVIGWPPKLKIVKLEPTTRARVLKVSEVAIVYYLKEVVYELDFRSYYGLSREIEGEFDLDVVQGEGRSVSEAGLD